ncbi:hypothetical protein [Romboutsia ilealis]|uniref:hypothetical protein n=1 Tax=Romboutsia ilealis TaxID=1115758 RepID=UPI0026F38133|nr:hypothetical protein [Romboutsia ilealis]
MQFEVSPQIVLLRQLVRFKFDNLNNLDNDQVQALMSDIQFCKQCGEWDPVKESEIIAKEEKSAKLTLFYYDLDEYNKYLFSEKMKNDAIKEFGHLIGGRL